MSTREAGAAAVTGPGSGRRDRRWHPAWPVAAVTFCCLVAAAGFRSSTGVLMAPIEDAFGWSRVDTSAAVSLNLAAYGLTAPFAAALMSRFGSRVVAGTALTMVAAGSLLTLLMREPWHLLVLWGLVVGTGSGTLAPVFGAVVANRWFVARRGLVTGVFSAAAATGQLAFLPLIAMLVDARGWRQASLVTSSFALLLVVPVLLLLRDRPASVGALPYGVDDPADPRIPVAATGGRGPAAAAVRELVVNRTSGRFWVLAGTFFVCGWSTNGLVGTHFVAASHDQGLPATTASGLLALIGVCDVVGTVCSGWLSDRFDPWLLLTMYYGLRGLSLLAVPVVLGPHVGPSLLLFVVFYGLDWVATVPPTVALCRRLVGVERSGVVFGWVFAAHMVGAAVAASFAGTVRASTGTYEAAWWTAGGLCLVAATTCLVSRQPVTLDPQTA